MATESDLFQAILSLDSYNRGYLPGIAGVYADETAKIGDAVILRTEVSEAARDASFYAVAYSWNGQTIISYRGTRFDGPFGPDFGDVLNGWTLSAGYSAASQAQMATNL